MITTTAGRAWVNAGLPEDMKDPHVRLDGKSLAALFDKLARERPDEYSRVAAHLVDVGRTAAYRTGGYSFGLSALRRPAAATLLESKLKPLLAAVNARSDLTDDQKRDETIKILTDAQGGYEKAVFEEAKSANNPIALQVLSGSRGKPSTVQTLIGGDLLYQDAAGRGIPVPVFRSYAQGLTPVQYFASAYGARKGIIDTKLCLSAGTSVRMADWSTRPIEEIRPGDWVTGADKSGRTFRTRVVRVFSNGNRSCETFIFRKGVSSDTVEITATGDHKILARHGDRERRRNDPEVLSLDTVAGSAGRAVTQSGFSDPDNVLVHEPKALLLGLLLGDGHLPVNGSVVFSCADDTLLTYVDANCRSLGLHLRKRSKYNYIVSAYSGSGPKNGVNFLKTWLTSLGLLGKKSFEKFIPDIVFGWDNASVSAFLAGLFATDGSVRIGRRGSPAVRFHSTSRRMVDAVRLLLELRFGVLVSATTHVRDATTCASAVHDLYTVSVDAAKSVLRFASCICVPGVKGAVLSNAIDSFSPQRVRNPDLFLVSRETVGELPTFDLEVEHPDHLFVLANGLIVSNSTASAGFLSKQLTNASHRLVVTGLDHDPAAGPDPNVDRGLPVDTDDRENAGALLARDVGGYGRNTVLTSKILADLKAKGHDRLLVRSPLTSLADHGGVYARDVGIRERGGLPASGDQVGIAAAQAVGEIVSQSSLGSKHCLAVGTLVRMADGSTKPIQDIRVGDRVLGADRSGRAFAVNVVNTFDNGVRDCVRTEFAVGMTKERIELICTLDHKLLGVKYQWALPHQLREDGVFPLGQKCTKMTYRMVTSVENEFGTVDEPYDLLLGLLLGDGCCRSSTGGVHLSCFDPTMVTDLVPELATHGLRIKLLAGQKGYYRISQVHDSPRQDADTRRMLPGTRNPLRLHMEMCGMWDLYAHEKQLPPNYRQWTNRSVLRLLAGLLATDGSVYDQIDNEGACRTFVNYGSTSLRMLEQVKELLHVRLGIHCGPIKTNNYGGRKRPMYSLNIHRHGDVRRFAAAVVEHVPGVKRKKLEELLAKEPFDGRDYSRFYKKRQTPVGSVPTFDIEVDHQDHLFVLANGLIVSNSGGVGKGMMAGPTGFKLINLLAQAPKESPYWSTHAQADGPVAAVDPSPAGGWNVRIGEHEHYVPPHADLTVKPGDRVEAGDPLSSGVPNPNDLVKHFGIGDGRRRFLHAFRDAVGPGQVDRRNLELVTRGLVNHVRMTDSHDEWLPDDVVPYNLVEERWQPRDGATALPPEQAVGKYLDKPVLHHTVGTRIRPSMVADLKRFGVKAVVAHPDPPPFEPHYLRGLDNLSADPDWAVRMTGSNLSKSTMKAVHRGDVSDEAGTSFVPSLARTKGFGTTGPVKPYDLSGVSKPDLL